MKKLPRHYSGPGSKGFWRLVNAEKHEGRIYLAAVLLQEIEERVLAWLDHPQEGRGRP